jgi:sugar lactone lactonase YvrE
MSFATASPRSPRVPSLRQIDNEGDDVGVGTMTIPKPKRINYHYVGSFSTVDSGGHPFWPKGIVVDSARNIYVTGGPLGVDKYDKTGKWVAAIGLDTGQLGGIAHQENGQLVMPLGIALRGSSLYVADTGWLQGFSTSGDYNGGTQVPPQDPAENPNVVGVAAGDGVAYVTDSEHTKPSLLVFHADGSPMSSWGAAGTGPGQFETPRFVAIGYQGELAVSDDIRHCVLVFSKDGKYMFEFGNKGSADIALSSPEGVASDEAGDWFVCDETCVKVFSFDGQYLATIGQHGAGVPGQPTISGAMCIALDNADTLYIANMANKSVDIYMLPK